MCTVTVIPLPQEGSYRVAFNRDELRTRPPAQPPTIERFGERYAVLPRDPAGGTWIASNDAGLTLALLNYNFHSNQAVPAAQHHVPARRPSRGLVIPTLLSSGDTNEAVVNAARLLNPTTFAAFRLLIMDGRRYAIIVSDGRRLVTEGRAWDRQPLMLTSSSLGDAVVETSRHELFRKTLLNEPGYMRDSIAAQDAFHKHQWNDRPALSVLMSRQDAHTVSRTTIKVFESAVTMRYEDLHHSQISPSPSFSTLRPLMPAHRMRVK